MGRVHGNLFLIENQRVMNTVGLFLFALVASAVAGAPGGGDVCQKPGKSICKSMDLPKLKFKPCCPGSECLPWKGKGFVEGSEPDFFCQEVEPITAGGDCRDMKGSCAAGTSCADGVCVADAAARKFRYLFW